MAFKAFRGKLKIIHISSGLSLGSVRIKKVEAYRLTETLEDAMNMRFETKEECGAINNQSVMNAVFNLCAPYSI